MGNTKIEKNDTYAFPLSNQTNTMGLALHLKQANLVISSQTSAIQYSNNNSTSNLPSSEEKNDAENEIDNCINEFQKRQWINYGRKMPTHWIDPFEVYD